MFHVAFGHINIKENQDSLPFEQQTKWNARNLAQQSPCKIRSACPDKKPYSGDREAAAVMKDAAKTPWRYPEMAFGDCANASHL